MKKLIFIIIIVCVRTLFSYSQDRIFILHEFVGDTIDQDEKKDFVLFPELHNDDFKFGIIYYKGESMKLNVCIQNDSIIIKQLDSLQIANYRSNIDKLLAYYSYQNNKDSTSELNSKLNLYELNTNISTVNIDLGVGKEEVVKSAQEGRRKQYLRNRALLDGLKGQEVIDAENYQGYSESQFPIRNLKRKTKTLPNK